MLARALVPLLPHEPLVKLLNSQPKPIVFMIVRQGSMMMVSLSFITITIPALFWHTLRLKALALLNSEYPCNSMIRGRVGLHELPSIIEVPDLPPLLGNHPESFLPHLSLKAPCLSIITYSAKTFLDQ